MTKKNIFSLFFLFVIIANIIVFSCPFSLAVSDDLIFTSPMAEPTTSDYCGYVNVLLRHKTEGYYRVRTIFWNSGYVLYNNEGVGSVVPINVSVYCDSDELFLTFNTDSTSAYYSVGYVWSEPVEQYGAGDINLIPQGTTIDTFRYLNSSFDFVGIQAYGNIDTLSYNLPVSMPQFSVLWNADAVQFEQANTIATLLKLISDNYQYIEGIKLEQILYSFEDVCIYLDEMLTHIDSIDSALWQIDWFLESDMYISITSIEDALYLANIKLQTIIDILNKSGESSFEELPTQSVNDYKDKEDELLGKDTSAEKDALKVEIDTTASDTIWNIIEQFLASNALVFGLFIAMLSLGVVSMILNR